jgi:DNA-binding NtrC family response regulator
LCLNDCTPSGGGPVSPHSPSRSLLIVEPDAAYRELLQHLASEHAETEAVGDFQSAYARLARRPPDVLVTNLRLQANVEGLQLAYVIASGGYSTRAVVYSDYVETWIVRELQRAGAFYEAQSRLAFALPAYARANLPVLDRRNPENPDRRAAYRGGRRASDIPRVSSRL